MKKTWKKLLAAGCALSMLMTVPGMTALADEIQEDAVVSVAEAPDEVVDTAEVPDEVVDTAEVPDDTIEMAEMPDADMLNADDLTENASDEAAPDVDAGLIEEIIDISNDAGKTVGAGDYTVGDGVTAAFDEETGAVTFYSAGGTLSADWTDQAEIDRDSIKSIRVASGTVFLPADSQGIDDNGDYKLFGGLENLTTLNLAGFDTSKVTNMASMFFYCSSLKELDVSGFDTTNVSDMNSMFAYCSDLTKLNVSAFNTQNVTDMNSMFYECRSLTELVLGTFDTQNVLDMCFMFYGCNSLTGLNVSAFDTSKVVDTSAMFYHCSNLTELDVSRFDTKSDTSMSGMFYGCSNLTELDVSRFNTLNVTDMSYMFSDCSSLTELDVSGFATSHVTDMSYMFSGCASLTRLNVSGFVTTGVDDVEAMFADCNCITELDLSSFDLSKVEYFESALFGCHALRVLKTPKKNSLSIALPLTMYDESGKSYTKLPSLSKSITLTKEKPAGGSTAAGFLDVQDPNHAYYKAIYWAADAGITKGYSDGTFGINRSCTRGEMIMFLWRYVGKPAPKSVAKSPFKDVPATHSFYKAVLWAYQTGVTKGYSDGTFGVNREVSRGECMMFLWRLKDKPTPTAVAKSPFKDVPKTHAFYNAILWGSQKGITKGYTTGDKKGTFGIDDNCTRGQIVTFLYRAQ